MLNRVLNTKKTTSALRRPVKPSVQPKPSKQPPKPVVDIEVSDTKYPTFARFSSRMYAPTRKIIGREEDIRAIHAGLNRPEVPNVALLADAGVGKTSIVQQLAGEDTETLYYEVDLSRLGAEGNNQMAGRLKDFIKEVQDFKDEVDYNVVLFFDEFHLIIDQSPTAVEAFKPILGETAKYGIRLIIATTVEEFQKKVEPNEALNQRLQRILIKPPKRDVVLSILKSMVDKHTPGLVVEPGLFEHIIDYSERYLPSRQQPRKSVLILDSMLGWWRSYKTPLNRELLNDVMRQSTGINANWRVNIPNVERYLKSRVLGQDNAIDAIMHRLNISVADLSDETRPQASFLFTGPTGVGKTELAKALATTLFGTDRSMIRFDMSEFGEEGSLDAFREELTDKVSVNPYSVILFDEIEKADKRITRLLLQVLDDARLSNRNGREVVFNNAYIILTTNVGKEVYESKAHYSNDDLIERENEETKMKALMNSVKDINDKVLSNQVMNIDSGDTKPKNSADMMEHIDVIRKSLEANPTFPTEVLNRLNAIIPFNPLNDEIRIRVARMGLTKLAKTLERKHGVHVTFSSSVVAYIVNEIGSRDTNSGGGRGVKLTIENMVTSEIAKYINMYPNIKNIGVIVEGVGRTDSKTVLKGRSHVVVGRHVSSPTERQTLMQRNTPMKRGL